MLDDLVKRSQPLAAEAKLLVLGGGYSGRCLANLARTLGTPVLCTRRSLDSAEADLLFDSNGQDQLDPAALNGVTHLLSTCLLYTSPSPRDRTRSRMPSSA